MTPGDGAQRSLFDDDGAELAAPASGARVSGWPPGLRYEPELIDADEERALIALLAALPLQPARYRGYTARRRVLAFGVRSPGAADEMPAERPIDALPALLRQLRERVAAWAGVPAGAFAHVLLTEYQPGTPLGWHRDAPPYREVAGVSLGSPARLRLRPLPRAASPSAIGSAASAPRRDPDPVELVLAPRSVYLLRGAARSRWQHGVPPVPALRYSITLRTLDAPR